MNQISASDLATSLNVSKGRISQYVAEGKLDGCFQGEGRARRFDLTKVAERLGKVLDKGQMLGNGLETRRAIRNIAVEPMRDLAVASPSPAPKAQRDGKLDEKDPDRLELAKIATAEENLRKLRRDNELSEGAFVLSSEVERQVAKVIGQEVAEFETVLRDGARAIADQLGVDFKSARKILIDQWREHRRARTVVLEGEAAAADLSAAEKSADI